jgi:hypothetical protein
LSASHVISPITQGAKQAIPLNPQGIDIEIDDTETLTLSSRLRKNGLHDLGSLQSQ